MPGAPRFHPLPPEDLLDWSIIPFLALTAFISLSGVMMPGPMFAVTLARGQRQPWAGIFISLGHAVVEFPLVILIAVGFARFFTQDWWRLTVGILGGILLAVIGVDMIRQRNDLSTALAEPTSTSLGAGILTSLANPYFFIWWATIGAGLVTRAAAWGILGLAAFFLVHWLCDFGWSLLVSALSFRAGRVWTARVHGKVFTACGLLLVGFGIWFVREALTPKG